MNSKNQHEIWLQRTADASVEGLLSEYRNPCRFQAEFTSYLDRLGQHMRLSRLVRSCELGCELGVTTLLLDSTIFERHALDLNPQPVRLLQAAATRLGQTVFTHTGDMFHTGWEDGRFDVTFSNGVLEHYTVEKRSDSLREAARVTCRGGYVLVGVPNHCSIPYRCAYVLRRLLGCCPFPPEQKIASLDRELAGVPGLICRRTHFFEMETAFAILPRSRLTALPFRLLRPLFKFEPYLRVFELQKV